MEMQQLLLSEESTRACFICLEEAEEENALVSCCTRCYGVAHARCWREWRANQRSVALRLRQSGGSGSFSSRDPFVCTICKTGRARLVGEVVNREWIETVLGAVVAVRGGGGRGSSDTDMFEDFETLELQESFVCCSRKFVYVNIFFLLSVGLGITVASNFLEWLSAGSAVLAAFLLVTQWLVFLTAWAVSERRRLWRESNRPLAALIIDELNHRSGRLFPADLQIG